MSDKPLYTSKSTGRSLWQEYRIYKDRVEFDTFVGKMEVPFEHIEQVFVSEGEAQGLIRGDLHLKNFRPALKLDWANFTEHVVLDKSGGNIHRLLFTPEDCEGFKDALEAALAKHRRSQAGL